MSLETRTCKACRKGDPALSPAEIQALLSQVPGWELDAATPTLQRRFAFKAYLDGAAFVDAVAKMAQAQDHHPDIELGYKKARVLWSTHAVNGLSENDFICAAKASALAARWA